MSTTCPVLISTDVDDIVNNEKCASELNSVHCSGKEVLSLDDSGGHDHTEDMHTKLQRKMKTSTNRTAKGMSRGSSPKKEIKEKKNSCKDTSYVKLREVNPNFSPPLISKESVMKPTTHIREQNEAIPHNQSHAVHQLPTVDSSIMNNCSWLAPRTPLSPVYEVVPIYNQFPHLIVLPMPNPVPMPGNYATIQYGGTQWSNLLQNVIQHGRGTGGNHS